MEEKLKIIITAEIDKLKDELKDGKKEVENFSKKSEKSFSKFNDAVQKAGDKAKSGLKVAATAIAGVTTALLGIDAATKDYRVNQAKLQTAFETAGGSAETAKDTYNDLYRVLGDDDTAVEAANHLAQLTTNQKDLEEWTTICQGVYATFGDSLPIESLTEAANETVKTGEVTGALADALNWAGISEEDFQKKLEACTTEAEREKTVRETLNGIYDDAAAKYEDTAGDIMAQNEAQSKLKDTMAKLGDAMAPVNTALAEIATEIVEKIAPHVQTFVDEHGDQIREILEKIADAVGTVIEFIVDNWEFISTMATIILGIATALSIFSTVMGIVNAVMYACPITWIIMAVIALIAAIVALVVYWDEIWAAAMRVVDAVVAYWQPIADWFYNNVTKPVADFFSGLWEDIKGLFEPVAQWFNDHVTQPVCNFFSGMWTKIKEIFAPVTKWFGDTFKKVSSAVTNAVKSVPDFFKNLWTKISGAFSSAGSWFSEKFSTACSNIKKAFQGIPDFFKGIWTKIKDTFSNIGSTVAEAVGGTVKKAINGVLSTATKIINGFISAINVAIGVINAIPGVNIKKLKSLSVPAMAKGGIVDSATLALIGEQGKEAVVPLEKNTEWLDMLVERLNAGNNKNIPIVLTVDGKIFAETSVKSINNLTRQRGSLPLVLA